MQGGAASSPKTAASRAVKEADRQLDDEEKKLSDDGACRVCAVGDGGDGGVRESSSCIDVKLKKKRKIISKQKASLWPTEQKRKRGKEETGMEFVCVSEVTKSVELSRTKIEQEQKKTQEQASLSLYIYIYEWR
jgi:hypothetical protein